MLLRARIVSGAVGVAVGVALCAPSIALAAPGGSNYPSGGYAWTGGCDTGTKVAPIGVAFEGFADPAYVQNQIDQQTARYDSAAWSTDANTGATWKVKMADNTDGTGTQCEPKPGEPIDPIRLSSPEGGYRTRMRTFSNPTSKAVVAAPIRQEKTTTACAGTASSPVWIPRSHAYDEGRHDFEQAFQGQSWEQGAYPMEEVDWGNTNSFTRCDGQTVNGSDGNVAVVHPQDSFGLNINAQTTSNIFVPDDGSGSAPSDPPPSLVQNGDQTTTASACPTSSQPIPTSTPANPVQFKSDVISQWQALGIDTVRFSINWRSIQQCAGAPYHWDYWDAIFSDLSDLGIRPIVHINGVPDPNGSVDWKKPCDPSFGVPVVNFNSTAALNAYSSFIQAFASHYGGYTFGGYARHVAIEIQNEPNTRKYWGGCSPDPTDYLEVLDAAVAGLNASGQNLPLLTGSPANKVNTVAGDHWSWHDWLEGIFTNWSNTDKQTVDAIGMHPYRPPVDKNDGLNAGESALKQVQGAQDLMANPDDNPATNDGFTKPIWVTEDGTTISGDPSYGVYVGVDPSPNYPGSDVDRLFQGWHDWRIYDTLRNDGVPVTTMFTYVDLGQDMTDSADLYGIVEVPSYGFAVKDAFCELAYERTGASPADCSS